MGRHERKGVAEGDRLFARRGDRQGSETGALGRGGDSPNEQVRWQRSLIKGGLGGGFRIELKAAPAELPDRSARGPVEEVDQRVLLWVACKIVGEDFDELFLYFVICPVKTFSHIKPVRPAAAVESQPETRAGLPDHIE